MFHKDSRGFYRVDDWDAFEWLDHGFGARHADLSVGFSQMATLKQVHSAQCVAARGRAGILGRGDALLENTPGALVAVKTADCLPILLVDPVARAVAAVHAGWRGTVARVAARAVAAMAAELGSRPENLRAAIGPGIGKCCFEVGPEVAAQFDEPVSSQSRARVDLVAANRRQLLETGVTASAIVASNLCTMCHPDEFESYRRDREKAGRMFSFLGLRAGSRVEAKG
ncbi:MAG: peptidoglycan editing factor PgeF [Bryobacteraceae bacterium]